MKLFRSCMACLCAVTVVTCTPGDPSDPSTDTESHWLESCAANASCPEGAECVCGICSTQCSGSGSCEELPGATTCTSNTEVPSTCPRLQGMGACLESCESDAECRDRDPALACVDGRCTRTVYQPLSCSSDPPGDERIGLGDEGLAEGDAIDPYLEDHLRDGAEVRIPEGTYLWNGGGFDEPLDYASLVGEGDVVLRMPDDYEFPVEIVTDTRFELRNVTLRGRAGADGGFAAYASSPGGKVTLRDVALPEGSVPSEQSGIYVDPKHAGAAYFIDLEIRGFASGGIKAYPPAASNGGAGGSVYVVGGRYRNNNIANLWLGPTKTVVRRVLSIQNGSAPSESGNSNTNQRGVWIDQSSSDLTIEDSDFVQESSASAAIVSSAASSGTITNVRIANTLQKPAIAFDEGDWTGEDVDITGSGEHTIVGGSGISDVCTGSGCDDPNSSPRFSCRN